MVYHANAAWRSVIGTAPHGALFTTGDDFRGSASQRWASSGRKPQFPRESRDEVLASWLCPLGPGPGLPSSICRVALSLPCHTSFRGVHLDSRGRVGVSLHPFFGKLEELAADSTRLFPLHSQLLTAPHSTLPSRSDQAF